MLLRALIVWPTTDATWRRDIGLSIPPFPGLGIRVDAYEVLNVRSVLVGDHDYDVTCIVELEGTDPAKITDQMCRALGFEIGPYP
jgi:hypothetical protein